MPDLRSPVLARYNAGPGFISRPDRPTLGGVSTLPTAVKRLLLGRPYRSDAEPRALLRKRVALPVLASDAISSTAYAPEEIFLVLSVAGLSAYTFTLWVGIAVAIVLAVVVAGYRQNVRAYPSGGGDYEVAATNLGPRAGLLVAAALMVDYVLTVAVSVAAAVSNIGAVVPVIDRHRVLFAVLAVAVIAAINLRGVREAGAVFAVPTYLFVITLAGMLVWGLFEVFVRGTELRAESADFGLVGTGGDLTGLALVLVLARAFASGSSALTGVEAIGNAVPSLRPPKARNAATTLTALAVVTISLLLSMIVLADRAGVKIAADPATQLVGAPEGYRQQTMVAQLAQAVFADFPPGFYLVVSVTALILLFAANSAFNGFPVLASVLAERGYLPAQLHTRGGRLALSNGIVALAVAAALLIIGAKASVTGLIQLYIVGVFFAFTAGQIGMVRHWNRALTTVTVGERRRMRRARAVNALGAVVTGLVLAIVLITKFTAGAWVVLVLMAALMTIMEAIRRHYRAIAAQLDPAGFSPVLPSRIHTVVLVSRLHKPTLRALAYARAIRPDRLEAVTVDVDQRETAALRKAWEDGEMALPLKVLESPYRLIAPPVGEYVRRLRAAAPRDVVMVVIPEYVVGRWWEQVLHNQSALRIKSRLLFQRGVMVTSVPWQLAPTGRRGARAARPGGADGDGYDDGAEDDGGR